MSPLSPSAQVLCLPRGILDKMRNSCLFPAGLKQPKATLSDMCAPDLKGLKLGVDWTFFKVPVLSLSAALQNDILKEFSVFPVLLPVIIRASHI